MEKLTIFQFHKGTIRTLIKSDNNCRFEFQFHKGTIRTYKKNLLMKKLTLFQFHKGTIRTISRPHTLAQTKISIP